MADWYEETEDIYCGVLPVLNENNVVDSSPAPGMRKNDSAISLLNIFAEALIPDCLPDLLEDVPVHNVNLDEASSSSNPESFYQVLDETTLPQGEISVSPMELVVTNNLDIKVENSQCMELVVTNNVDAETENSKPKSMELLVVDNLDVKTENSKCEEAIEKRKHSNREAAKRYRTKKKEEMASNSAAKDKRIVELTEQLATEQEKLKIKDKKIDRLEEKYDLLEKKFGELEGQVKKLKTTDSADTHVLMVPNNMQCINQPPVPDTASASTYNVRGAANCGQGMINMSVRESQIDHNLSSGQIIPVHDPRVGLTFNARATINNRQGTINMPVMEQQIGHCFSSSSQAFPANNLRVGPTYNAGTTAINGFHRRVDMLLMEQQIGNSLGSAQAFPSNDQVAFFPLNNTHFCP